MTLLRIDQLSLRNFRCFVAAEIDLHESLTVLVADNAQGKTAILDGLKIALDVFVSAVHRNRLSPGIGLHDVRTAPFDPLMHPQVPCEVRASGLVANENLTWARSVMRVQRSIRNTFRDTRALRAHVRRLDHLDATGGNAQPLPVVAYYGNNRLSADFSPLGGRRYAYTRPHRLTGYEECFNSSSAYRSFSSWYEAMAGSLRDPTNRAAGGIERPEQLLAAVRQAVRVVLEPTGWTEIDWKFPEGAPEFTHQQRGYLVVEHPRDGRFPVPYLSDGIRNMIALVGDLAQRCARLNPHLGESAALETSGVVLIDEVDLHLHPRWQQLIVDLLRKAFPRVQFVLSTHSPHVLSTVDARSIRVIESTDAANPIKNAPMQTQGSASAEVLAKVMDVDPVPKLESTEWLRLFRGLVQNNQHHTDAAANLREQIVAHFGEEHPAVTELAMLERVVNFKQEHQGRADQDA